MAYNPADFELVEAPAGSAPPYNPADFELVAEPEGSGFWRQSLDLPVSALGGVVTGLKGMSDVFGANNPVSQELAGYQQFYNQSLSSEGQADQQEVARIMQEAQDKGMWEQIKAGGRAFAVAPLDTAAQSLGTMAPIVATGLAGRAVGLGARGVQIAQAVAGSGMQAGTVKDEIYQNTKQFLMQQGKSEEEADKVALEAQSYGGQNLDQILLGAGLGAADALFGAERILGGAISKTGKEVTGGVIANALKTGVSEAIPEALQGGQEPLAKNIALQREGYNVPTMRGVFAQGTMEGLAGFAAGAPVGAAEGMAPRLDDRNLPPIQVDQQPAFTPPPAADPVVVQEAFGDPTTAAAEPAQEQAAPASYNPDDFEVVEDGLANAVEPDMAADVFAGVPKKSDIDLQNEIPLGLNRPQSADPSLRDLDDDAFDALYNERTKAIDAIEKQIDESEDSNAILLNKERRKQYAKLQDEYAQAELERYRRNQSMVASGSLFEDMLNLSEGQDRPGWINTDSGQKFSILAEIIASRPAEERADAALVDSLMVLPERIKQDPNFQEVLGSKMQRTREAMQKVMPQRPAPAAAQEKVATKRAAAQQPAPMQVQEKAPKPRGSSAATLLSRRALRFEAQAGQTSGGQGTAVGSVGINERIIADSLREMQKGVESGQTVEQAASRARSFARELVANHNSQRRGDVNWQRNDDLADKQIGNAVLDIQEVERGEATVDEQGFTVAASPDTPAKRSRRRIKNMTAQSGAIDLSIVEDLVEYGKTIYRAGMTYAQWSAAMTKEFGQAVADFLRQAFDRIVQAYKDSPYSDTTGAVGDVRPNASQKLGETVERRQSRAAQRLRESGMANPETVEAMGDTTYERMRLFGDSGIDEKAKAEIERLGGPDKAYDYLTDSSRAKVGLLPVEVAMALRLMWNYDATGNTSRAGTLMRVASLGTTTMGQGANVMKLLTAMRPETIEYYAQSLVEKEAASVSDEFAKLIGEARKDLEDAKKSYYKQKLDAIHSAILELQERGEKIINKIKQAIPDTTTRTKMLREIRDVLQQDIGRSDAIKEVSNLMKTYGISPSNANAWSNSIVSTVFKMTNKAKGSLARDMAGKHKWRVKSWKKLLEQVESGNLTDADFVANLTALSGLPHIDRQVGAKLRKWTAEYRAATDEDIKTILATQIWEEVHSQVPPEIAQRLRASMYISMLMYPLTWIKNVGGNLISFGGGIVRDAAMGTIVDPVVAKFTGERKTSGRGNVRTKIKALAAPYNVYQRGKEYALQQNPGASRYEQMRTGLRHLRLIAKATTQNKYSEADAKFIGGRAFQSTIGRSVDGLLSIALGAPDYSFWSAGFRSSLAQQEGAAKINGDWTGRPTWDMVEEAYMDAADGIFQKSNLVSEGLTKLRKIANKVLTLGLTDQIGPGTSTIAFSQVPGALFVKGMWDWSLGGFLNAAWQVLRPSIWRATGGKRGGEFNQRAFNKALTEAALGSGGLIGGGFVLASLGILTASDDDDRDVAAANKQQGILKFAVNLSALWRIMKGDFNKQEIKHGDFMVPYDWAQPLAMPLAMGAEIAVQQERARIKGIKTGEESMLKAGLWAAVKSIEDQPLISGMAQFVRTWGLTNNPFTAIAESYLALPSMMVPQIASKWAQYVDNTARETRGGNMLQQEFNQLVSRLPWLSQQYPAKIDVTGQAVERYQDAGNTWYNLMLNPFVGKAVKTNPVLQEATRLLNATGDNRAFPRQVGRSIEINGKKVDLTNEQITRHNYYLGNMTMAMLTYRMSKPSYQRASDQEKARLFVKDLTDVAAATRASLYGLKMRDLSPQQRWILREFMKLPVAKSEPPVAAAPSPR